MSEPISEPLIEESKSEISPQKELWNHMVKDLHVLMKHPVDDPERQAWIEERDRKNRESKEALMKYGFSHTERYNYETRPHITIELDTYLRSRLIDWKLSSSFNFYNNKDFELEIVTEDPEPRCTWKKEGRDSVTQFKIFVNETDTPTAQEELLHAAQEILIGNTENMRYSTFRTSEQLVHTSLVLDLAMSFAVQEENTWEEWNQKANDLKESQRQQFIRTNAWDQTLLGKDLNKRFQYKDITLEQIGLYWRNLGKYFDVMFDDVGGITNDEMVEIFEFGCLAYGVNHRDLSYSMVDLTVTEDMTNEEAGRIVVDWAKKVMVYLVETGHEDELLSHHTDVRQIPDQYFNYQVPDESLKLLANTANDPNAPLPARINISTLKDIGRKNWLEKVGFIMEAWQRTQRGGNPEYLNNVLIENGMSKDVFNALVRQATVNYQSQFSESRRLISLSFNDYKHIPDVNKFDIYQEKYENVDWDEIFKNLKKDSNNH